MMEKSAPNHSWTPVCLLMCSRSSSELVGELKFAACIPSTALGLISQGMSLAPVNFTGRAAAKQL